MSASVIMNLAIVACVVIPVLGYRNKAPLGILLRFFTTLSNLLCALSALLVAVFRLCGGAPNWVLVVKYIGTASVAVTLMTVLLFLGPTKGYKALFSGPDLWLHLPGPVLAIVSLLLWDKPELPFAGVLLGVAPVLLYGAVYLYRVIYAPEARRWPDFYGFNRGGRWPLSFALMLLGSFAVSVLLWLI